MSRVMNIDPEIQVSDLLTTRAFLPQGQQSQDVVAELAAFNELSAVLASDPTRAI
ncbi:hypothetical protein HNQ60_005234 [Povalibacter uvarum]|uniref:Uncharacterized protein n=1 Tax=Povalibacter uvarum TaxID=732238 RepID=A0A841HWI2_9GAMM|nr:hypothetical protein [Povalibacter uvarum]MBB6096312.1 hypothetical protein [Povalibacter uvarum]